MRAVVPYASSGRRPRAVMLGDLGCRCRLGELASSGAGTRQLFAGLGAADWQTSPSALRRLAAQVRRGGGFGSLGLNQAEGQVVQGVAAKGAAVGASALATYAGAGAIAGPIGAAAGVVIALVVGLFMGKHYFNVAQMNADEDKEVAAWRQYLQIQGHVAGRALGLQTMASIWNGAVHSSAFPDNNAPKSGNLCFHNGCGKYPGDARWVTATIQGCSGHNCFPDALTRFNGERASKPANVPDAVYFIDSIFLPMFEATAQIKWISDAAGNPEVRELLYDVADAYLAQYASNTTPYVEYPQSQIASEATAGAVGSPGGPIQATAPAAPALSAPASSAVVPYVPPLRGTTGMPIALWTNGAALPQDQTSQLISSLLAQGQSQQQAFNAAMASLAANGVNTQSPEVQQQVAGAVQAATGEPRIATAGMSWPEMALLGLLAGGLLLGGLRGSPHKSTRTRGSA